MFSMLNNKKEIIFMFSDELCNKSGIELTKNFLKKGESNLVIGNLEHLVRRGVFPNMPRKQVERLNLKIFRIMHNLPKREMVNYVVEQHEEWQIYKSDCDLIKATIRKKGVKHEKIGGNGYMGLATYYPDYLRNII